MTPPLPPLTLVAVEARLHEVYSADVALHAMREYGCWHAWVARINGTPLAVGEDAATLESAVSILLWPAGHEG